MSSAPFPRTIIDFPATNKGLLRSARGTELQASLQGRTSTHTGVKKIFADICSTYKVISQSCRPPRASARHVTTWPFFTLTFLAKYRKFIFTGLFFDNPNPEERNTHMSRPKKRTWRPHDKTPHDDPAHPLLSQILKRGVCPNIEKIRALPHGRGKLPCPRHRAPKTDATK